MLLQNIVSEMRLRFTGHIHMAPECPDGNALDWMPTYGKRGRGMPRKTWRSTLRDDLHRRGFSWDEAETLPAHHVMWRNMLPIVPRENGGSKC